MTPNLSQTFASSFREPVRMLPGEEKEYASTYLLQGELPDDAKELNVTYEFKVER